jgi:hypothetical protein
MVGTLTAMAAAPLVAHADVPKAECIQANTTAQDARRELKFSAARQQLARCGDPSCPAVIRDDCTRRLDELEKAQPTIVFDAKDASGHDVSAVKVTVDGKPLADKVTGAALVVDPGEHTFTFTVPGGAPVTQTFIIKEGVKDRHEVIVLGGSAPTPPQPKPETPPATPAAGAPAATTATTATVGPPPNATGATPDTPSTPPDEKPAAGASPLRMVGWVVGGVGLALVGLGTVFGVEALSTKSSHCPNGTCTPAGSANTAYSQATISTVGLLAGGVMLAGGVGLVLFAPSGQPSSTASVAIGPLAGPSTAGACLSGRW